MFLSKLLLLIFIFVILFSGSYYKLNLLQIALLDFLAFILVLVGSFGRLWSSIYIEGKKTSFLVIEGPYSITRNPLYIFSFVMLIGYAVALKSIAVAVFFLFVYIFLYAPTILNEEKKLKEIHGDEFEKYFSNTPRFFPRIGFPISSTSTLTTNRKNVERVLVEVMGFIFFYALIKLIEAIKVSGAINPHFILY